jgi:hypothetical protein
VRNNSELATQYNLNNGFKLPAIQAIGSLWKAESYEDLFSAASSRFDSRNGYYNWSNIWQFNAKVGSNKPTIEFRQHQGTLNFSRVTAWIKTLVGIVDAVRKLPEAEFQNLVNICANEVWQKHGDGEDDARQSKFGLTLADSTFTIVDLLEYLGLDEPAAFYRTRGLYHHEYTHRAEPIYEGTYTDADGDQQDWSTFQLPDYLVYWEFEDDEVNFPKGSDQYVRATQKKELWERTVVANKLNKTLDPNYVELDTTSDFWPDHTLMPRIATPTPSEQTTIEEEESVEAGSEDEDADEVESEDAEANFSSGGSAPNAVFSRRIEEPRAGSGSAPRWCDRFVDGRRRRLAPASNLERLHKRQRTSA